MCKNKLPLTYLSWRRSTEKEKSPKHESTRKPGASLCGAWKNFAATDVVHFFIYLPEQITVLLTTRWIRSHYVSPRVWLLSRKFLIGFTPYFHTFSHLYPVKWQKILIDALLTIAAFASVRPFSRRMSTAGKRLLQWFQTNTRPCATCNQTSRDSGSGARRPDSCAGQTQSRFSGIARPCLKWLNYLTIG